ncbi:inorganic phosphate transporter [Neolewinella lacunae]|uniref:Inorganic phosphate transporter n=1 Tax=Neolewinella lacunae TaxID=1517758 RepID=A0A923PN64_9BACT|nr:inorganic phosphate transporter [Neolewinella lacunae]MBC6995495.1 inorganic phosphate transporter [Neolewinella lacunae]MDN3635083.1 inorganic phosphate transporter [Neolewinella lacunae]
MSELFTNLTVPFLLAMFLAMNMGGSGTAPAFSAAYGANVLKRTLIPGLFGIMVLAGALIAGKEVSLTLGDGLLDHSYFTPLNTSIILFTIGVSILVANLMGVPQSTSQATVLSIAGAATALDGLNTRKLFYEVIPTWVILPIIAFLMMLSLSKWVFPLLKAKFFTDDYAHLSRHKGLKAILILSSLYVAFSIGANNVANAAAPIASLTANEIGQGSIKNFLPIIILSVLIVAPCFAIGSSLLGHKVTETTGKDIVEVSPFYATIIAVITATLLLVASVTKGIPTSLVQLNGVAFIALSVSKVGFKRTFGKNTVQRFFTIWAIAPVFAYVLTYVLIKFTN